MDERTLKKELRARGAWARRRRKHSNRNDGRTPHDHELRPLLCKECGKNEEMVPRYMDAVICWRCTAKAYHDEMEPDSL